MSLAKVKLTTGLTALPSSSLAWPRLCINWTLSGLLAIVEKPAGLLGALASLGVCTELILAKALSKPDWSTAWTPTS